MANEPVLLLRYVGRRLAMAVAMLWIVSLLVFLLMEIVPGDVAVLRVGPFATPEQVELMRRTLGLDRSPVARYLDWAINFVCGNWGESWRFGIPIAPLVGERLLNSLLLAGVAFAVIVPISVLGGVLAAVARGRWIDHIVTNIGLFGIAVPEFVSSMFLILFFSLWIPLLPATARIPDGASLIEALTHLILPVISLGLVLFGYIGRIVRASVIEELSRPYVRSAVLKGLAFHMVVWRHVLRNALLPPITVIANQVSWLVGGLVVVETVFNYPGIGQLLLQAALGHDFALLEVTVLIKAALLILVNLVADLVYGVANPRLRLQVAD